VAEREHLLDALSSVTDAAESLKRCVRHNSPVLVVASHLKQDADNLRFAILGAINGMDEPAAAPQDGGTKDAKQT
jgi:hypothetical protein